jgi:hypothetical protein
VQSVIVDISEWSSQTRNQIENLFKRHITVCGAEIPSIRRQNTNTHEVTPAERFTTKKLICTKHSRSRKKDYSFQHIYLPDFSLTLYNEDHITNRSNEILKS